MDVICSDNEENATMAMKTLNEMLRFYKNQFDIMVCLHPL